MGWIFCALYINTYRRSEYVQVQSGYNVRIHVIFRYVPASSTTLHSVTATGTEHVERQGYVHTQGSSRVADILISGHTDGLSTYK